MVHFHQVLSKARNRRPLPVSVDPLAFSHRSSFLSHCLLALLFCLLTLSACASLPRFEEVYQRLDVEKADVPTIVGPHGQLSPAMSARVMER